MRVLISGASGLIGTAITKALVARGDEVFSLVRRSAAADNEIQWDPQAGDIDARRLAEADIDVVVHLAGETVQGRWTAAKKERIRTSRVTGTSTIAGAIADLPSGVRPSAFIVSSAIGIYGDRGDQVLKETANPGSGFLAEVAVAWEEAAAPAREIGIRTVHMRTGIVQTIHGGALKQALLPFKLGIGGPFGSGAQWFSWISLHDTVRAFLHAIDSSTLEGPVNVTAPNPVTNKQWAKALGAELHRPVVFPVPRFAALALFGEFANELYASTKVLPRALQADGFVFDHATIQDALHAELSD